MSLLNDQVLIFIIFINYLFFSIVFILDCDIFNTKIY